MNTNGKKQEFTQGAKRWGKVLWLQGVRLGRLAGMLGVLGFGAEESRAARVSEPSPAIRIRVNNYARASAAVLSGAQKEAGRVLARAGLRIEWQVCPATKSADIENDPCREPLKANEVVLRIIAAPAPGKFQDAAFGFAVVPLVATVFFEYVVRTAEKDAADFEAPVLLGCVIAHEVGHLLLGLKSHADSGVMQARWERKQVRQALTGSLLFSRDQGKSMQAEMQKRMSVWMAANR
jgi:hypothetical protein